MFLKLAVQRTALENQLEALDLVFSKVKQTTVTQLLLETFDLGGGFTYVFKISLPFLRKRWTNPVLRMIFLSINGLETNHHTSETKPPNQTPGIPMLSFPGRLTLLRLQRRRGRHRESPGTFQKWRDVCYVGPGGFWAMEKCGGRWAVWMNFCCFFFLF